MLAWFTSCSTTHASRDFTLYLQGAVLGTEEHTAVVLTGSLTTSTGWVVADVSRREIARSGHVPRRTSDAAGSTSTGRRGASIPSRACYFRCWAGAGSYEGAGGCHLHLGLLRCHRFAGDVTRTQKCSSSGKPLLIRTTALALRFRGGDTKDDYAKPDQATSSKDLLTAVRGRRPRARAAPALYTRTSTKEVLAYVLRIWC